MMDKKIQKSEDASNLIHLGPKGRYVEDEKRLKEMVNGLRAIGAKIVLTMGTFDFIHIGHFLYLEKAKNSGDILIVGVDSDKKVKERKGPDRPIVSEAERVQMLTHVRHVDIVVLKNHDDPKWHLIKTIKPDVLVATSETYSEKQLKELESKYCGKVLVLDPQATTSTTAKLRRLNIGLSNKIKDEVVKSIDQAFDKVLKNAGHKK